MHQQKRESYLWFVILETSVVARLRVAHDHRQCLAVSHSACNVRIFSCAWRKALAASLAVCYNCIDHARRKNRLSSNERDSTITSRRKLLLPATRDLHCEDKYRNYCVHIMSYMFHIYFNKKNLFVISFLCIYHNKR